MQLEIGSSNLDYVDFVSQGWRFENGGTKDVQEIINVRQIEIKPRETWTQDKEVWFSIDKETYEVKPVKVTLLPGVAQLYCKRS